MVFPCVVKPLMLSASRGVIRADDEAQFVGAVRRLESPPDAGGGHDGEAARQVLVEGFIPGREVALEGLLVKGDLHVLALFDKPDPLDGPFFEETIYVTPSRLPVTVQGESPPAPSGQPGRWVSGWARARRAEGQPPRALGDRGSRAVDRRAVLPHPPVRPRPVAGGADPPSGARHGNPIPRAGAPGRRVMMIPIPRAGVLKEVRGQTEAQAVPGSTRLPSPLIRGRISCRSRGGELP